MLFPFGEPGWHTGIKKLKLVDEADGLAQLRQCSGQKIINNSTHQIGEALLAEEEANLEVNRRRTNNVSVREYCCYMLQIRENKPTSVLHTGRLAHQFQIDCYVKIETQQLEFLINEQANNQLRVESFQGIIDGMVVDGISNASNIGLRFVLSPSFKGGPRDMRCRSLNSFYLVSEYRKPEFLLTTTCNPKGLCVPEAMWQIFVFLINDMHPTILELLVHSPNMHQVWFHRTRTISEVLDDPASAKTCLTEFFVKNDTNPEVAAMGLLYREFPRYFVWKQTKKVWNKRKQGISIRRLVVSSPSDGERPYDALLDHIFPNFTMYFDNPFAAMLRAILSPKNDCVDEINNSLIEQFPGDMVKYYGTDITNDPQNQAHYQDFLNNLNVEGLPPYLLRLKKNSPIMLVRNINPLEGFINGMRLICKELKKHVIGAEISSGERKRQHVFIPRIPLEPSDKIKCPVPFKRRQFPVRLCFAMTINKSQGQTLHSVVVFLPKNVFSHGQLYVAFSRVRAASSIKVLIKPPLPNEDAVGQTRNVVYREIIQASS